LTDSTQETPQPVYFFCDVSVWMGDDRLTLAESLLGSLAAKISTDPLLKFAVRWGVEHYGTTGGSASVVPIQQVDLTDTLPALQATVEEPAFGIAATALTRRMGTDMTQLDADYPVVRSPFILVLTSGAFTDAPDALDLAVSGLLTTNPRSDQALGWDPTILFLTLRSADGAKVGRLVQAHDSVEEHPLAGEQDVPFAADVAVGMIRHSVAAGVHNLRYARWVVEEKSLTLGAVTGHAPDAALIEVTAAADPRIAGPVRYQRFLDAGTAAAPDAAAHPFDDLLDLVARGNAKQPGGRPEPLADRSLWPLRLVVADDPRAASGLLVPAIPAAFTDDDRGSAVPRSIRLLGISDDPSLPAAVPVAPLMVPAGADVVARMRLCADLADTIDLAHSYGVVLGAQTLMSGVFATARRSARIILTDCGQARPGDPADPYAGVGDLIWLGRFIEQCAVEPAGAVPVLDAIGADLLTRAKSNAPAAIPRAATWRDYLDRRTVQLQGPPVLEQVEVEPRVAPTGAKVRVTWWARYADSVVVQGSDGTRMPVPAKHVDHGYCMVTVTREGPVTVLLRNKIGETVQHTEWVHVFGLPWISQVPVPAAPPLTSTRVTNELSALLTRSWLTDRNPVRATIGLGTAPVLRPQRRRLWGRGSRAPRVFPYDVGGWFLQRPARSHPRPKRWWRLPWA
jgi:hypothetical protein